MLVFLLCVNTVICQPIEFYQGELSQFKNQLVLKNSKFIIESEGGIKLDPLKMTNPDNSFTCLENLGVPRDSFESITIVEQLKTFVYQGLIIVFYQDSSTDGWELYSIKIKDGYTVVLQNTRNIAELQVNNQIRIGQALEHLIDSPESSAPQQYFNKEVWVRNYVNNPEGRMSDKNGNPFIASSPTFRVQTNKTGIITGIHIQVHDT